MKHIWAGLTAILFSAGAALAAPSASDVLAANHAAVGNYPADRPVLQTEYAIDGYGLTGTLKDETDQRRGWMISALRLGTLRQKKGYDGKTSWEQDASGMVVPQNGREAAVRTVTRTYLATNAWWAPDFGGAKISVTEKTEAGRAYDVLTVSPAGGNAFTAWFDAKTHMLFRLVEPREPDTTTTTFTDYARHDGVMLAGKSLQDDGKGKAYLVHSRLLSAAFRPAYPQSFYAPPSVQVADYALLNGRTGTVVPVQFRNNHIFGQASFDGHAPVKAVFDTGAVNLVSPAVARAAGLKSEGKIPASGIGSQVMQASVSHAREIRIGDAVVKNQQIIILPLDQLTGVVGEDMPSIVGFETFRRFVTRIDYLGGTLSLTDPKHFDPKDAGTPIPFILNGRTPQVKGAIEGIPAVLDLDTGSGAELSVTSPFEAKHHLRRSHKGLETITGWGTGGPVSGYVTRVQSLRLGPVTVENLVADISKPDSGAFSGKDFDGNVGSKLLKRFIVTFDYGHQILYLKKQPLPVTDIASYSRTGICIVLGQDGFRVFTVTKGSPADMAGLRKDDEIVAVDGQPVSSVPMGQLELRMRTDPPGTEMHFRILRKGEGKEFTVTLKDQI